MHFYFYYTSTRFDLLTHTCHILMAYCIYLIYSLYTIIYIGKLWAFLRIIYSTDESDITSHGYTPFTLQYSNSILSYTIETKVITTLIGIITVLLHGYDTDLITDFAAFSKRDTSQIPNIPIYSRNIILESQKFLRNILDMNSIEVEVMYKLFNVSLDVYDYKGGKHYGSGGGTEEVEKVEVLEGSEEEMFNKGKNIV